MPDMVGMRISTPVTAVTLLLLAACGTSEPTAAPASSATTTTTTPTTATSTTSGSLVPVYDKWAPKFATARGSADAAKACAPLVVQTEGCGAYLTRIVLVAGDLQGELKGKRPFVKTLEAAKVIVDAGAAFGNERCREGGGEFAACQAHVEQIVIGSLTTMTALQADDLAAP